MKYFFKKNYSIAFISLATIFFIISILNPNHNLPWVSYFSEKYAFLSFLFLIFYTLFGTKYIRVPLLALPLFLICLIPILQYIFDQIVFFETAFFSFIYLLFFFFSMVFSFNLKNKIDFEIILIYCSYIFIFISFFSSLIILIQWLDFTNFQPYLLKINNSRAYGNLAQPNQMATILCMGLISLWYIYEKLNYKVIFILSIAFLLLLSILLTQSRTAWVILIFLSIFYFFIRKKINLKINVKTLLGLNLFFIFNALMLPFYNSINPWSNKTIDVLDRMASGHERIDIWKHFFTCVLEQPVWGYGWYQIQRANASSLNSYIKLNSTDSTHNLFLDIFLWCGIPLGGLIIVYMMYLLWGFYKNIKNKDSLFCFILLIPIVIHSMFEYPLFYSYFLLPLGFLIGLSIMGHKKTGIFISTKFLYALGVCFLIFIQFVDYGYDYMREKRIFSLRENRMPRQNENLFQSFIEQKLFDKTNFIIYWIKFNPYQKLDQSEISILGEQVKVVASKQVLVKYAMLLAYNGHQLETMSILNKINKSYAEKVTYNDLLDPVFYEKVCQFCYKSSGV